MADEKGTVVVASEGRRDPAAASPQQRNVTLDDALFIDDIYDIALDPANLTAFIERLGSQELDVEQVRAALCRVDSLSAIFQQHLERAEKFLDRVEDQLVESPLQEVLASYDSTPALIIDANLKVVARNASAFKIFALHIGDDLELLPFDGDDTDQLLLIVRRILRNQSPDRRLLHLKLGGRDSRVIVLHIKWLEFGADDRDAVAGRAGHVLLASTELHLPVALDQTLHEVFGLSEAERDIVRALVEGKPLKTIARERGRSIGTVRTQLRSVLAKTQTHTQSELIRVTLSLREMIERTPAGGASSTGITGNVAIVKEQGQSFNPIERLRAADGRNLEYLVQGPLDGKPVIFSHMGYGLARWPPAALELAAQHGIKVVSPVRSGFGGSDPIGKDDDILAMTRQDTLAVLDHLEIDRCPYIVQGNDMLFAMDFAAEHPDRISEIVGLSGRLPLPSELQYPGMGWWHHFLLSNARHAPHLLYFTTKAGFTLARKIGRIEMFRAVHKSSPADLSVLEDEGVVATLIESSKLALSDSHHAAFAYAKELLATESDWSDRVVAAKEIPTWFISGLQDPLGDLGAIAAYRERFPWIAIDVIEDGGQLLFFQHSQSLIPKIAEAAMRAGN